MRRGAAFLHPEQHADEHDLTTRKMLPPDRRLPVSDMQSNALERPTWACVLCQPPSRVGAWRRADDGYRTCSGCLDRIRQTLSDIVIRYRKLDPKPGSSTDHGGRGAPGFGSRSPGSDHVIAMRDPRSSTDAYTWVAADGRMHKESERPALSVFSVLDTIAWDIAEARGIDGPQPPKRRLHRIEDPQCHLAWCNGHPGPEQPPPSMVEVLARWIDAQLDWATRRDSIVEIADQLRQVLSQLRPVTGDRRRRIGLCPNVLDEGDSTRECGSPLYAPTESARDDTIRCHGCGRAWVRGEWLRLGELLDSA